MALKLHRLHNWSIGPAFANAMPELVEGVPIKPRPRPTLMSEPFRSRSSSSLDAEEFWGIDRLVTSPGCNSSWV
ncbi:hypothetical protein KCU83_g80, partial [Aureobasidium melanogenum]